MTNATNYQAYTSGFAAGKRRKTEMSLPTRLARLERKVANEKPEMKCRTHIWNGSVATGNLINFDITDIAQGDRKQNRSGNKIKIWRVEVRGATDPELETYLIQKHAVTEPVFADFTGQKGGMIVSDKLNTIYTEWRYHYPRPYDVNTLGQMIPFKIIQKFKGMECGYDGFLTAAYHNGLIVTMRNPASLGATARSYDFTVRVWFTDP